MYSNVTNIFAIKEKHKKGSNYDSQKDGKIVYFISKISEENPRTFALKLPIKVLENVCRIPTTFKIGCCSFSEEC